MAVENTKSDDLVEPEFKTSFTPSYKRLQMSLMMDGIPVINTQEEVEFILDILYKQNIYDTDSEIIEEIINENGCYVDELAEGQMWFEEAAAADILSKLKLRFPSLDLRQVEIVLEIECLFLESRGLTVGKSLSLDEIFVK